MPSVVGVRFVGLDQPKRRNPRRDEIENCPGVLKGGNSIGLDEVVPWGSVAQVKRTIVYQTNR